MKSLYTCALLLAFVCVSFAQEITPKVSRVDIADFNKKLEVALWLAEYDSIAWKSTDLILAMDPEERKKLGPEWFCFQDKNGVWHAVYGGLKDGKYAAAFHFIQNSKGEIVQTDEVIESEFLTIFAKALSTANQKVSSTIDRAKSPGLNQYIRREADGTFRVWILPAFQPEGIAVYGGEFVYEIDKTGSTIVKDHTTLQENFRGFNYKPPREIWLNFREYEKPTLGSIFFVWYYKSYFTKIFIDNKNTTSTLVQEGSGYVWVHVEKINKPAVQKED